MRDPTTPVNVKNDNNKRYDSVQQMLKCDETMTNLNKIDKAIHQKGIISFNQKEKAT